MIKINNIKGTNMELTGAIVDYVTKKITMLEKYINAEDTSAQVDIEVEKTTSHHQKGDVFRAEANFSTGGKLFRAEATNEDLYASIDEMKDELARVLNEENKKERSKKRKGAFFLKRILKGLSK